MAIQLDIKSELPQAIRFTNEHVKQLPFSVSQALNATAQGSKFLPGSKQKSVLNASRGVISSQLDRPKEQTALRATVATKNNLQVTILPKDRPYKANPYIVGNIQGGNRPVRRWERDLKAAARQSIPANLRLVPTTALSGQLDRFGNVPRPVIRSIKSGMSTTYLSGGANYFAGKPRGGNRPYGIYRRFAANNRLQAMFIGFPSLSYGNKLTRLVPEMERNAQRNFGSYLRHFLHRNVAANVKAGRADLRRGFFL